jgi:hypothetical protein
MPTPIGAVPVDRHLSLRRVVKAPNLAYFRPYAVVDDIDLDGVVVPGLRAEFLRREAGCRTVMVSRYSYSGRDVFQAWGYQDEEHCRYFAVYGVDGRLEAAQAGCPRVRVLSDGSSIAGLALHSASGVWLIATPAAELAAV